MPNYLSEMKPANPNPVAAGLSAFGAVQELGQSNREAALSQMKIDDAQNKQNALAELARSKDVDAVWKLSPEVAMQAEKYFNDLGTKKQEKLIKNIKVFDELKPYAIRDPQVYENMYNQADKEFSQYMMKPEQFAQLSLEDRQKHIFEKETYVATLKQIAASKPNYIYDQGQGKIIKGPAGNLKVVRPFTTEDEKLARDKAKLEYEYGLKKDLEKYKANNSKMPTRLRELVMSADAMGIKPAGPDGNYTPEQFESIRSTIYSGQNYDLKARNQAVNDANKWAAKDHQYDILKLEKPEEAKKMYLDKVAFFEGLRKPKGGKGTAGGGKKPSERDLSDYQRAIQFNKDDPAKLEAIRQKAMGAWGYAP